MYTTEMERTSQYIEWHIRHPHMKVPLPRPRHVLEGARQFRRNLWLLIFHQFQGGPVRTNLEEHRQKHTDDGPNRDEWISFNVVLFWYLISNEILWIFWRQMFSKAEQ